MSTDATTSLAKFNDPSQWEHCDYNVPIFIEHEIWEIPHPLDKKSKIRVPIFPGKARPKNGKFLYAIGAKELEAAATEINDALQNTGNAVKVFIGHTDVTKGQKANPDVIGYGVGAKIGTFGPKGHKAILAEKICYSRGHYEEAKKYPERSPEFQLLTGRITGLALLKTDPKLPMGMMTYQVDGFDTVLYAADFLKKEEKSAKAEDKSDRGTGKGEPDMPDDPKPEGELFEGEKPGLPQALPKDPTQPPTSEELPAEHKEMAGRYMEHYKREDPVMRYCCQKYETEMNAAAAPALPGMNPKTPETPAPAGPDKGADDAETEHMSDALATTKYQEVLGTVKTLTANVATLAKSVETLTSVNTTLTQKYAVSEANRIEAGLVNEGYVIKDRKKLRAKLAATDDAGRKLIVEDVRENYAQTEVQRDPSQTPMIGVSEDPAEGEVEAPTVDAPNITQAVRYAEEHRLDLSKPEHYEQVAKALASKNGTARKSAV